MTDDEQQKASEREMHALVVKECPILYSETKAWEFGYGWYESVSEFSRRLEFANNRIGKKVHLGIVIEQIKEKFGDMVVYHTVRPIPTTAAMFAIRMLRLLYVLLGKVDYKTKCVALNTPHERTDTRKLSDECYVEIAKRYVASNVWYTISGDGIIKNTTIKIPTKIEYAPTRHLLLCRFRSFVGRLMNMLKNASYGRDNSERRLVRAYLESLVKSECTKLEDECSKTCEWCGRQIGTTISPRCTTLGWISNICTECAAKSAFQYVIGDSKEVFKSGERVISNDGDSEEH